MVKVFEKIIISLLIYGYGCGGLQAHKESFEMQYHPVGEGNCITAKLRHANGREDNMLFDCGTRSHHREALYREYFEKIMLLKQAAELKEKLAKSSTGSTKKSAIQRNSTPPDSAIKPTSAQMHDDVNKKFNLKKKLPSETQEDIIEGIRQHLTSKHIKRKQKNKLLDVALVVISHPDVDHFNWLRKVFDSTQIDYKIGTIILGGYPEEYGKDMFDFLTLAKKGQTKIYFPALSFQPIPDLYTPDISLQNMDRNQWAAEPGHKLMPSVFSDPKTGKLMISPTQVAANADNLVKDLPSSKNFQISFLALNPSHFFCFPETDSPILRQCSLKDKNADSIVLKLTFNKQSAILTGDATGAITRRVLANYQHDRDFLKTDTVDASHHGSHSHESNNEQWITATSPGCVFFNSGISFGHPSTQTYAKFRAQKSSLKRVELHSIWVGKAAGSIFTKAIENYVTRHALFSTLNNGLLTVKFDGSGSITVTSTLGKMVTVYQPTAASAAIPDEAKSIQQVIPDDAIKKIEAQISVIVANANRSSTKKVKPLDQDYPQLKKRKLDFTSSDPNAFSSTNQQPDDDRLKDFDYKHLNIISINDTTSLTIRNKPLELARPSKIIYPLPKNIQLDGQKFKLQNVSGVSMRCFFNAVGLEAEEAINNLETYQNDPIVRYMIANEIVSAAATPDQMTAEVKEAVRYDLYQEQRRNLSLSQEIRGLKLTEQNSNVDFQKIELLPAHLQNLDQQDTDILNNLRTRACALPVFQSFIKHHLRAEQMMVALHDMKGEEQGHQHANYTSIDAVAYVHKLGLKIYQLKADSSFHLVHQFIPDGATQIAYVYHEGIHFQALLPM